MNKKAKLIILFIIVLILTPIVYFGVVKYIEYRDVQYYNETYTLNNSGDTYEEKLRNIHDTYPLEFYEYVNNTNTFINTFYIFDEKPNEEVWGFSYDTCRENKEKEKSICIYSIGFAGKNLYLRLGNFVPRGVENYDVQAGFSKNNFVYYDVQRADRAGKYAWCTFKDATLTVPVNKIARYQKPDYMNYPENPYREVNCYDEGKLYQDFVPLLEKFQVNTIEAIKKLIMLSEDYKSLTNEEVIKLRDQIALEKSLEESR